MGTAPPACGDRRSLAERLPDDRFNRTGTKREPGEPSLCQRTAVGQQNKGAGQGKQEKNDAMMQKQLEVRRCR